MKTALTTSFEVRDDWRRLLVTSAASPTLGPRFAAARWEQRVDREVSLRLIRFEHEGVLVGMLPLAARERRRAGMSYRELVTLGSLVPPGSALALGDDGLLVLPGCEQAVIASLRRMLDDGGLGSWDGLTITRMRGDAVIGALLRATLGALGPCVLDVSAGERYARLEADSGGADDDAHVVSFGDADDELVSTLIRRAGLAHLRDACDALAADGAVEVAWRGQRSTATAICASVTRSEGISVIATCGVDDAEQATLHRARMRRAADAGVGEYTFWHPPPNVARLAPRQRPVRRLVLERRGRGAQVRGVATMASELWRSLSVRREG